MADGPPPGYDLAFAPLVLPSLGQGPSANDIVRRHHRAVRTLQENISRGTLPRMAGDHHLCHTDAEVAKWNRQRAGLRPEPIIGETTYEADDEGRGARRKHQERRRQQFNWDIASDEGRSTMATRLPQDPNLNHRLPHRIERGSYGCYGVHLPPPFGVCRSQHENNGGAHIRNAGVWKPEIVIARPPIPRKDFLAAIVAPVAQKNGATAVPWKHEDRRTKAQAQSREIPSCTKLNDGFWKYSHSCQASSFRGSRRNEDHGCAV